MAGDDVLIRLTQAQAFVLCHWLSTLEDDEPKDEATRIALWKIEGQLESKLLGIFDPNYAAILEHARETVISNQGPG
jgi:hypothetical protein